jgi:cytochrome c biogenesis protein
MRFAISLLVIWPFAIGTLLTRGDPHANYVNQFGPFWADLFRDLGLYNVYGAWWFMLILVFLVSLSDKTPDEAYFAMLPAIKTAA